MAKKLTDEERKAGERMGDMVIEVIKKPKRKPNKTARLKE